MSTKWSLILVLEAKGHYKSENKGLFEFMFSYVGNVPVSGSGRTAPLLQLVS